MSSSTYPPISTFLPLSRRISVFLALSEMGFQRATGGTKKTFSAVYSFGSSGAAPSYSPLPFTSLEWRTSKALDMYFQKDQAEYNMLILRSIHVFAQFIRGLPECRLDGFLFIILPVCCLGFRHYVSILIFSNKKRPITFIPGNPALLYAHSIYYRLDHPDYISFYQSNNFFCFLYGKEKKVNK